MRKCVIVWMAVLGSISAVVAQKQDKKYPSLLWEISGNGLTEPSYLYGTMHVSRKLAFNLSDTFFIAINRCDMVALELNVDEWVESYYEMEQSELKQEFISYYKTPSSFYKVAFQLGIPENDMLKQLLKSKPYFINSMLYRNSESRSDFEEDTYLDLFIFQSGKKLNKKITGLEDFKTSLMMVKKSSKSETLSEDEKEKKKEERELKRLLLRDLTDGKSFGEALENAYRRGDLDMIDSLDNLYYDNPNYHKFMLHDRNTIMADNMDSLMKKYKLFTGVGAAHLPGEKGVIEQLRKKGYKVRPVVFSNKNGNDGKTKIDAIRYPVKMQKQFSGDSVFSVDVPGKLYELGDVSGYKSYMNLDMANGSYYYIQRLNYYGKISSQDEVYMKKRIDSLLYENIPGKIISRKTEKNNLGFTYFDILNKTAKGDMQRYQIHFTGDEIFVFKMSGTEEYVTAGPENELFFGSIRFYKKEGKGNYLYSASGKNFEISFPSPYVPCNNVITLFPQGNQATATHNNDYYFFIASSLYDFDYIEEDTFELNVMAEIFAGQLEYKIEKTETGSFQQYPVISFKMNKDTATVYARIVINGPDYFMMGVKTKNETTAENFYKTLRFTGRNYKTSYGEYTDTVLHFKVKTHLNNSGYRELTSRDTDSYYDYFGLDEKTDKKDDIYLPLTKSKVFVSHESGEKVYVEYKKHSMYYQEKTMDDYWKKRYDGLKDNNSLKLRVLSHTIDKGITEVDVILTDTNSLRAIRVKMIQKCGVIYTLKASVDSIKGLSGFSENFFDTFTPADTCIGIDVTSDKLTAHFFNKIYSTDTSEKKRAQKAIEYVAGNLNDEHAPLMIKIIEDARFHELEMKEKARLMRVLGNLDSKLILPFYEKVYPQFVDSVSIQLAILTGVARQKNSKSAGTFLKLLNSELPVSSDKYDIWDIFEPFYDSLETAVPLYPGLLKFTKYPEYKEPVYALMSKLVKEGKLKPKAYASGKNEILMDAVYELKLYMSSIENDKDDYSYNKSSRYTQKLSEDQEFIYDYASLLAPFYSDAKISRFLTKAMNTGKDNLTLSIAGNMIKNNYPVHDTLLRYYITDPGSRITVYRLLKENKQLEKFDAAFLNQQELVKCMLYSEQLSEKNKEKKDTIVFLEKIKMKTKYKEGYVYVFKSKAKDKIIWKLSYSGLHPVDEKEVNTDPELHKTMISYEGEKQFNKERDYAIRKIRTQDRNRASVYDFDTKKGSGYYYDDY